ncbi:MAG: phosphoglycerate mutase [Saprospiraceae bacterium]|nr:MAG: phosphoglycerate mutase [Saprospiraceae bacterium]
MKQLFFLVISVLLSASFSCKPPATDASAEEMVGITTFILVRHAEKADDGTKDPDLTDVGKARAERLATLLQPNGIEAVYSTAYKRTRQTAEPLATTLNLPIQEYDPKATDLAKELIKANQGKTVLVVGHSNSTPTLVNQLIGKEKYSELDESVYGKLYVVTIYKKEAKAMVLEY